MKRSSIWMLTLVAVLSFTLIGCDLVSIPGLSKTGLSVTILVSDADGKPVEAAIVNVGGQVAVTGSDGKFAATNVQKDAIVKAIKPGWSVYPEQLVVRKRGETLHFIAIDQTGSGSGEGGATYSVRGTVFDTLGNPIDRVLIMLSDEVGTVRTVVTDEDGLFDKADLIGIVTITAAKAGWEFQPQTIVVNAGTASADFHGTPSEDTSYRISGHILMSGGPNNGIPVGAVTLTFEFLDIPSRDPLVTITKADGSWQMDGLVGRVRVTPTKNGHLFTPGSQVIDKSSVTVGFAAHDWK